MPPRRPGPALLSVLLACAAVAAAAAATHAGDNVPPSDGPWAADDDYNAMLNSTNMEELLECVEAAQQQPTADGHCTPSFDRVLCWKGQPAGTLATQTCFAELNGVVYDNIGRNATRWCLENATWSSYSNYSACMVERVSTEPETADHSVITSTIYYVGYTVSTVALTMAVFIFSYFRELHCLRNRIHMNLMLAYISADIVWILNMAVNVYLIEHISQAFCFIFVVLLHYTMLTHFLWMFVEGLYLYTLVVKTFQQGTAKLPVYLVIGWGIPLVVVVSWVVTRLLHPEEQTVHEQDLCTWLAYHWSDWVYQAPVIAVLAINAIFLCFVMYVLITKLRSDSSMRPGAGAPGDAEQQQSKKAAKALLVLIPLLGITYILVIAGPTEGHAANVFAHVRALLLSTQGLLVAIFYCFLNTDVRHTLANRWERRREVRMLGRQRNGRAASVNWTNRDTFGRGTAETMPITTNER